MQVYNKKNVIFMTFVAIPNVLITDFGLYSCLYTLHFTLYTRKIALKKRFSNIRHIIIETYRKTEQASKRKRNPKILP